MIKIDTSVRDTLVRSISGGDGQKKVRHGFMESMRKALALVEHHHKRKEWISSAPGGKLSGVDTDPEKLTVRTGLLLASYMTRIDKSKLLGGYGSDKKYSRIHEFGGIAGGSTIPARPGLARSIDAKANEIEKILADGAVSEIK